MSYPKAKYDANLIANYFILKSNEAKLGITNKKLQKLLYYSQGWSLVFKKRPIFEEDIEAWAHGPAIRETYKKYKIFGFSNIKKEIELKDIENISNEDISLLEEIWKVYGKYDANYLERLTHQERPWINARNGYDDYEICSNIISLEDMEKYFTNLLNESRKNSTTSN